VGNEAIHRSYSGGPPALSRRDAHDLPAVTSRTNAGHSAVAADALTRASSGGRRQGGL